MNCQSSPLAHDIPRLFSLHPSTAAPSRFPSAFFTHLERGCFLAAYRLGDALDSSVGLVSIQPSPGKLWREGTQRFNEPERGELDKLDPLSLELSEATWYNTQLLSRHRDPHRGWAAKNGPGRLGEQKWRQTTARRRRGGGGRRGAISSWTKAREPAGWRQTGVSEP